MDVISQSYSSHLSNKTTTGANKQNQMIRIKYDGVRWIGLNLPVLAGTVDQINLHLP